LKSFAKDASPAAVFEAVALARKATDQLERAEQAEKMDRAVDLTDRLIWSLGVVFERLALPQGRRGLTVDAMSFRQKVRQIREELRR
jgi:nucleoid-associated protein YgaU